MAKNGLLGGREQLKLGKQEFLSLKLVIYLMTEVTDKDLINLKDAASISGYSPDYIGQLIRAGKISGKQVFCNVQWMTTAEAVMEYKNKGITNNDNPSKVKSNIRKIGMEFGILKLFFKTFKSALPIFLLIILSISFFLAYFMFLVIKGDNQINEVEKHTIVIPEF